jgi:hypothetical protein
MFSSASNHCVSTAEQKMSKRLSSEKPKTNSVDPYLVSREKKGRVLLKSSPSTIEVSRMRLGICSWISVALADVDVPAKKPTNSVEVTIHR